jgi:hypothetical protein
MALTSGVSKTNWLKIPIKMKNIIPKIIIFCCLLGNSIISFSQQVVAASGNTFERSNGSISFTLGEPVTGTINQDNTTITQGFHQPILKVESGTDKIPEGISCTVYPNPTSNFVRLELNSQDLTSMEYLLFSSEGKMLNKMSIESSSTEISFSDLNPAVYILIIKKDEKEIATYKIIKQ